MNKFIKLTFIAAATVMAASASAQTASAAYEVGQTMPAVVQQPAPSSGSVPASEQPVNDNWVSGNGDTVWMNGNGERCVRSGLWTPATANKGCDGALVEVTPPPPPPVTTPAPTAPEKVTYQKVVLFDFDKAVLKPEGKQELNALVEQVKSLDNLEMVVVNGYTDEIGKDDYNKRLSARRTEPVKSYLESMGIDGDKIYTEGKGKADPVVSGCSEQITVAKGKAKNKREALAKAKKQRSERIKCLAPNRRVTIDAIGTTH